MDSQQRTDKGAAAKPAKGKLDKRAEMGWGSPRWYLPVIWGLVPIAILAIVFALPLKTVPVQVTETYWDTEMRRQPYTVTESYTEVKPYVTTEMRTRTVYDYCYFDGCYPTTGYWRKVYPGGIVCEGIGGIPPPHLRPPSLRSTLSCGWPCWVSGVRVVSYPEEVTKYRTVTKYREVVKYREVPTQVLKERTVTKYEKISIWAYLFR